MGVQTCLSVVAVSGFLLEWARTPLVLCGLGSLGAAVVFVARFGARPGAPAELRVREALDVERTRLRHDLHDGLGPLLSGIGLCARALSDLLGERSGDTERALLNRIRAELSHAATEVRRVIEALPPAAVEAHGLVEALHRHARFVAPTTAVEIVAAALPVLPPSLEATVYRIVTEAVTNVVRHADARHATVALTVRRRSLLVSVADDGRGIARSPAGVGLTSIRHRAEAAGGRLSVRTAPGSGTEVRVRLPLPHNRAAPGRGPGPRGRRPGTERTPASAALGSDAAP
ncbi:sensor histidine kinase [Streptomyces sp. NPDC047081]|uniref:sensor histidine kinase n=1 Tax=Streptomyces sp. NPDC047081 TaxID=3154706 RepID=UPI0033F56890